MMNILASTWIEVPAVVIGLTVLVGVLAVLGVMLSIWIRAFHMLTEHWRQHQ